MTRLPVRRILYAALLAGLAIAPSDCRRRSPEEAAGVQRLIAAGRYDDAEAAAREAVEGLRSARAEDARELANASDALVRALIFNGRGASEEASTLAERTLRAKEADFGSERRELLPSILNLSEVLTASASFDEAVAAARRALALSEQLTAPDSIEAASALDCLGRGLAGAMRYDDALSALERSLHVKEASLPASDVAIARTLEDLGLVLQRSGNYDKAGIALRRAAAIQEQSDVNHPAYARTLNLLAQQLWFEGQLNESKVASERAVELSGRTLRPNHPTVALSLRYLAATLGDLGDLNGYTELTKRALLLAEANFGADHFVTAEYRHQLGVAEMEMGDYQGARLHLQQALRSYESRYGARHEHVATVLSVLALADARLGDSASARRDQERAAAIYAAVGGPNHPFVAIALTELAGIYNDQNQATEALPLLQQALEIREKNLGAAHRDVARTLSDMAFTLMQLGESERAQRLAQRALGIWERLDAPDAPDYATVLALYAELQASRGDPAAALAYYERALAVRARVFGTSNPVYAEAQSGLALAQFRLGDRAAALRTAAGAEATGRDHLRLLLRSLPERQALNYAAARPRGLNLLLSQADSVPDAVGPAIDGLIRSRALVLDEIAERHRASRRPAEQTDRDQEALRSAQQRLANLSVRGPGVLSAAQYAAIVDEARRESEAAEEDLAAKSASYRAERTRAQLGLEDITRALTIGSALVSFVQYDRILLRQAGAPMTGAQERSAPRTQPSYLAFVLRADRVPVAVQLGAVPSIDRLVFQWRSDIASEVLTPTKGSAAAVLPSRASGALLRRAVWDKLSAHLAGADRVFVVPDGSLSLVALAALPVGARSYLLESGSVIHYLSAERDLVPAGTANTVERGLLAVGGPSFDDRTAFEGSLAGPSSAAVAAAAGTLPLCGTLAAVRFQPLDGTLQEVSEIGSVWNRGAAGTPTQLLTGRDASESAFKRNAPNHRILHVATHGFFLDGTCLQESAAVTTRGVGGLSGSTWVGNPLRLSGLALAGANRRAFARADEDDGILTAEEVASLDLEGVEWAVLSACDTGVGEIKAGEGVFGLRRAFQVAGAHTVIMSLWSVDDQATRAWMRALYEGRFQKRLSTADAVHQASLTVFRDRRARGLSTHPFFWAAFVAAGDWR